MILQTVFEKDGMVYVTISPDAASPYSEGLRMSVRNWKTYGEQYPAVPGQTIGEAEYDELHRLADRTEALLEAARILSAGDKSERDLRKKLRPKFSEDAVDYAVRVMERRGYLDEIAQCERIAANAVRTKHHGPRRIKADLLAHGYTAKAVDTAVQSISEEDFSGALTYLLDRRFPEIETMDASDVKKAAASLMRLGFPPGAIFEEIRKRRKK